MIFPFAEPWILLLLIIPATAGWWEWRRIGFQIVMPFDGVDGAPRSRLRRWIKLAGLLPTMLLACAVVFLAGPQRAKAGELIQEAHNVQILVDVSGSMRSKYGNTTRFGAAMNAIDKFVHYRHGDSFAFSFFGTGVFDWMPLTKDVSGISLASQFFSPELMPRWMNGTMIGNALRHVRENTLKVDGDHMIIIVTDGQSDDLGAQVTPALARSLLRDKIAVFSIFIGDPRTDSPADLETLGAITGGRLFSAEDPKQLTATFKQIDAMVPAKFTLTQRTSLDAFMPVSCVGLTLLVLQLLVGFGLRYTPW